MTREESIELIEYLFEAEHRTPPRVEIRDRQNGFAKPHINLIVLPEWLWSDSEPTEYVAYYAIHEACHFLVHSHKHNGRFREAEKRWLREFGLLPIYSRAYVKGLATLDGRVVWARKQCKTDDCCVGDVVVM
jgi:hypothetical protein